MVRSLIQPGTEPKEYTSPIEVLNSKLDKRTYFTRVSYIHNSVLGKDLWVREERMFKVIRTPEGKVVKGAEMESPRMYSIVGIDHLPKENTE